MTRYGPTLVLEFEVDDLSDVQKRRYEEARRAYRDAVRRANRLARQPVPPTPAVALSSVGVSLAASQPSPLATVPFQQIQLPIAQPITNLAISNSQISSEIPPPQRISIPAIRTADPAASPRVPPPAAKPTGMLSGRLQPSATAAATAPATKPAASSSKPAPAGPTSQPAAASDDELEVVAENPPPASTATTAPTGSGLPPAPDPQTRIHPALYVNIRTPFSVSRNGRHPDPKHRAELDERVKKVLVFTASQFTEWLIQWSLIRSVQYCPTHPVQWGGEPRPLRLGLFTNSSKLVRSGGYVWVKSCCRPKYLSVFYGSMFDTSKLATPTASPVSLLKLMYHWCCQTPLHNVVQWVGVKHPLVDEVYGLFRAVCMLKMEEPQPQLGGKNVSVQVGLVSLGTAGPEGRNKHVKVEVLGMLDEKSKEVRLLAFDPNIKNRIQSVVSAVQDTICAESTLLLDHSISPEPFRPHFSRVTNATGRAKEDAGSIMSYLRRSMPRMFQMALVNLKPHVICQFIAEIAWREKYGTDPNETFSNLVAHLGTITQQNEGSVIDMLRKIMVSPSMDLKRKPRKQKLQARPDSQPEFSASAAEADTDGVQSVSTAAATAAAATATAAAAATATATAAASQAGPVEETPAADTPADQQPDPEPVKNESLTLGIDALPLSLRSLDDEDTSMDATVDSDSSSRPGAPRRQQRRRRGQTRFSTGKGRGGRPSKAACAPPGKNLGVFFKLDTLTTVSLPELTGQRCWECKLPLTHPNHLTGVYACKRCRYVTSCEKIYPVHQRVFHSRGVAPVFSMSQPITLARPLYCPCGYRTDSGNRLAAHLAECEVRTAYPSLVPQPGLNTSARSDGASEDDPVKTEEVDLSMEVDQVEVGETGPAKQEEEEGAEDTPADLLG